MSLITANQLAKSYGAKDVFRGVSLSIPPACRIALVGANGVGKTTLLRILIGEEEASSGDIQRARKLKVGYLPQEAVFESDKTLWEECLTALSELQNMEAELRELEVVMGETHRRQSAMEQYGSLLEEFERRGGFSYETRIRQTLSGLGFTTQDFHRPVAHLSGGERTRALLARLLLSDVNLLVLDEPTNHLDIQAVEWLEGYLSQWSGAVLLVSHDRYFLDRVVDHIWELHPDGLEVYRGNYSAYLEERQKRWEWRGELFEAEKERLEKELDFIKRNIAAQQTNQAKGKLRRLSRELQAIEKLGVEQYRSLNWSEISRMVEIADHPMSIREVEARIKALRPPGKRPPRLRLDLQSKQRSGDLVLRTRSLVIGYADEGKPLFRAPDLLLKRGECAALIGPNGAGKTTFLKTLLGEVRPYAGEVILGASLKIGYFAQAHEDLHDELTLFQEIELLAPNMLPGEIRSYLARYLFTEDQVFMPVGTLSGGERGRLALAKLALMEANLLLLDEPTNHLDIPAQEILQEALSSYAGTILLVSHDRYLIDALASQVWEIHPQAEELTVFEGSYTQYRQQQSLSPAESPRPTAAQPSRATPQHSQAKLMRQRQQRLQQVEEAIQRIEAQLADLGEQLAHPPADLAEVQRLGETYARLESELESLFAEWEALHAPHNGDQAVASPPAASGSSPL